MNFEKQQWHQISLFLMLASAFSVFAATWGFIFADLILASTQWLLVAAVLAIFGLYARLEE
ncbi:MAG: hypothetical protein JW991_04975 [Candidatus Pacebacteria bacterium]|nr:hypothetical protein [Candidatus Paceibacterota bacterium]